MKNIVFKNLREMGLLADKDIIIYYNNHYADKCLDICKGLDDCASVLIDGRIIDEDEIKNELIEYYERNFKNNVKLAIKIVEDYLNEEVENIANLT